jgi:hypothetical protein
MTKVLCPTRRPHSDEGVVSAKAPARPALVQEGFGFARRTRCVRQGSDQASSGPGRLRQGSNSVQLRRCVRQGFSQATITEKPIPTNRDGEILWKGASQKKIRFFKIFLLKKLFLLFFKLKTTYR